MRHSVAVLSLIACGAWSAPAAAQYELGGGNVLDSNTGAAYGNFNLPARGQDFRSRNLLVVCVDGDVHRVAQRMQETLQAGRRAPRR